MSTIRQFTALSFVAVLSSCGLGGDDENYDTADGYDTSNPYGIPKDNAEGGGYQAVNPPADANPSYSSAAYEETAPVPPAPPAPAAAVASTHTVVKGDTIWGLGKKYGVSQDAIRTANSMDAGDNNIRLGQSINIPAR
jgi:lipoprotein NlpD